MKKSSVCFFCCCSILLCTFITSCDPPPGTILFAEDFSDDSIGVPPGSPWLFGSEPYDDIKVFRYSNHQLELAGPSIPQGSWSHEPAVYTWLNAWGGIQPTYVTFWAHPQPAPGSDPDSIGWFTLRGQLPGCSEMVPILWIGFVETEDGKGLIFVGGHLYPLNGPIDIDQPFEIEIRNIDWSVLPDPTYDLYINDVLYAECVPFDRPVDGFERLDLLNITHGYVIFDDIVLIEGDVDHVCGSQLRQPIEPLAVPGLPHDFLIHHPWEENIPPDLPLPSVTALPSPTRTSTPQRTSSPTIEHCVFTALQNAHCRASDQVGSSELDILMQGEMAELIALNSTYTHGRFRLQNQVECWIRLGLLEGPENPFGTCGVPVIELPRVTPTSHVCDSNLDQAECEASGGMWNAGLSAEPYCVCPE